MSELLFALFGGAFGLGWLIWMFKTKRTPDRGMHFPSVTSTEAPGTYWREVLAVGMFLAFCGFALVRAAPDFWN